MSDLPRMVTIRPRKLRKPPAVAKPEPHPPLSDPGVKAPAPGRLQGYMAAVSAIGTTFHRAGDTAAKASNEAGKRGLRRTQRNQQALNQKARAVGTACETTNWLYGLMASDMRKRGVPPEKGVATLEVVMEDALTLIDDLCFDANISMRLKPQER